MRFITLSSLGCCLVISGCVQSNVSQFYHQGSNPPPVPGTGVEPELRQGSGDSKKDLYAAAADGWGLIGYSAFNGPQPSRRSVIAKAKEVRAALVIENVRYSDTKNTGAVGTTALTHFGAVAIAVPTSVDRYQQAYFFLARSARIGLGAVFVNMSPEEHANLGTNKGMRIVAIINDSPAFQADVLADDVLLSVDGIPVYNKDSLHRAIEARYGKQADIVIQRRGETIHKLVSLPAGGAW